MNTKEPSRSTGLRIATRGLDKDTIVSFVGEDVYGDDEGIEEDLYNELDREFRLGPDSDDDGLGEYFDGKTLIAFDDEVEDEEMDKTCV